MKNHRHDRWYPVLVGGTFYVQVKHINISHHAQYFYMSIANEISNTS